MVLAKEALGRLYLGVYLAAEYEVPVEYEVAEFLALYRVVASWGFQPYPEIGARLSEA